MFFIGVYRPRKKREKEFAPDESSVEQKFLIFRRWLKTATTASALAASGRRTIPKHGTFK